MLRIFAPLVFLLLGSAVVAQPLHAIAMHGEPALPSDYKHFSYVNPDAKKGGKITYGVVGTFDSLNPFILKSMRTTARGVWDPAFGNLLYEPLMSRSRDEPFTLYGLLAQTVEWDDARSFIQFNLNPAATWSDGEPVTPDDVIFTFDLLKEKGRVPFSGWVSTIAKIEKVGNHGVRITFNEKADRETPMILASSLPILPKHAIDAATFDQSTLKPPIGSGPYRVKSLTPGDNIVYERNPDYWGKDVPAKVGIDNYDQITIDYFLQDATLFEAFKKGVIDVYPEGSPNHWNRAYDFPAVNSGDVVKDVFKSEQPTGMLGFVFNTRRAMFKDVRVRKALAFAFDFEWANRNLLEGAYQRTQSFWQNSILGAYGNPADGRELALLGPAKDKIDPPILDGTYKLPSTDGSGSDRKVLRQVVDLLKEAGYTIKGRQMVGPDGKPLSFGIMTQSADQEKLAIAFQRTLQLIGVSVDIRTVDDAQYQARSGNFDYDVIVKSYTSSLSPGAEQFGRWSSASQKQQGSLNFAGAADPDLDRLMEAIVKAKSQEDFVAAVRAFDRLLVTSHYVLPLYSISDQWVARWKHIGHPDKTPLYGYQLPSWWDTRAQ